MRSPVAVAFRGLIMLVFMVAIPVIALFWNSIPGYVDKLVVLCDENSIAIPHFLLKRGANQPVVGQNELFDAPQFEPKNLAGGLAEPRQLPSGAIAFAPAVPPPASMNSGLGEPAVILPAPEMSQAPPQTGVRQASHEVPRSLDQLAGQTNIGHAASQTAPSADRFTAIQQRLRDFGATYYLLESFGTDGTAFRFHCKMAIAGNSRYTRHFEATDRDPIRAMLRVLEAVETWRADRQP